MERLRIALAQVNAAVGDLDGNRRRILDAAAAARRLDADVVLFPELALCGYPPEDLLLKPRFLRDCARALKALAAEIKDIIAVVGCIDTADGKVYNAAAAIRDGQVADVYHKIELPNYGVFDENRYFTPGSNIVVFGVKGVTVCLNICEDIWHEGGRVEWSAGQSHARIVLNLSASPFYAGKLAVRRGVIARFAKRTGAFVCYTNLVGGQDELVFDGTSMVVDPEGRVAAAARRFEEDLLVVDIGDDGVRAVQANGPTAAAISETEEVSDALVLGTRDYVRKNGFSKVAIGLSGGVDSAVTAALAVAALGKDSVVGVTMPSQYTSSETRSDAALLAAHLGIPLVTVPIQRILAAYMADLKESLGPEEPGVTGENLQARIRGNILMALSNRFGWLILSTGNKSEIAVGYCTLYGDMAGGFAVIKDVPKMLVYKLARLINQKAGTAVIPQSVLDRAPTAELKPNQKDTDSLPPYPVLDRILRVYVEEDAAPSEIIGTGYSREIVEKVIRMVDRNEYKRRQAAPGIKITPKAFGRDRRLPITNLYRAGFVEEEE